MITLSKHNYIYELPESSIDKKERIALGGKILKDVFGKEPIILGRNNKSSYYVEKILATHDRKYISGLRENFRKENILLDSELKLNSLSWPSAFNAAASMIDMADILMDKPGMGICLTRPGSHHAGRDYALGLCLLNNLAIVADHILSNKQRVAILDFDAHHGNGTEDIFKNNSSVLTISLHQEDFFPGTGYTDTNSETNLNIPIKAFKGDFNKILLNRALHCIKEFKPEALLVEAGVDGHIKDNLSNLRLTDSWFYSAGEQLREISNNIPVIIEMGGGYTKEAIEEGWRAFTEGLIGKDVNYNDNEEEIENDKEYRRDSISIEQMLHAIKLKNINLGSIYPYAYALGEWLKSYKEDWFTMFSSTNQVYSLDQATNFNYAVFCQKEFAEFYDVVKPFFDVDRRFKEELQNTMEWFELIK